MVEGNKGYMKHRMYLASLWKFQFISDLPNSLNHLVGVHKIVDSASHLVFLLETSFYKVVVSERPKFLPTGLAPFYACLQIFSSDLEP